MPVLAGIEYDALVYGLDVVPRRDIEIVWGDVLHLLVPQHVLQGLARWHVQVSRVVLPVNLLQQELSPQYVGLVHVEDGIEYLGELVSHVEHVHETEGLPVVLGHWKVYLEGVLGLLYHVLLVVVEAPLKLYVHLLVDVTQLSVNV